MNTHYNKKVFQGANKLTQSQYFEGWYYKQTTAEGISISFIPGVSYNKKDPHAFIQCLYHNGKGELKTHYIRYSLDAFSYGHNPFVVTIGENHFSESFCVIHLEDMGVKIEGVLRLGDLETINSSPLCPNIMGFFSYIPYMECNHDVISMKHPVQGKLMYGEDMLEFTNGIGYIEKDWGKSFPKEYIWLQCNDFEEEDVNFICSIATIPFGPFSFKGFFCVLRISGEEYRFATYNGSQISRLISYPNQVDMVLKSSKYKLRVQGKIDQVKALISPSLGEMNQTIKEGLGGHIILQLIDADKRTIYKGFGGNAGVEIEM